MNKTTSFKGPLMLAFIAIIWGLAFVAQSVGMDYVGVFTFNGLRFYMGAIVLLPFIICSDISRKKRGEPAPCSAKKTISASIITGIALFAASTLQQAGIACTSSGKAGFITAMYIVIVPVLGIFFKRKTSLLTWLAVAAAVVGLYFLCINEEFSVSKGDIYLIICSFFWAVQILLIDRYANSVDCLKLAFGQFLVSATLSMPFVIAFEDVSFAALSECWLPLAYTGILSSGVAYTLQPFGQKYTSPTLASLIMSLEAVFATIGGFVILHEELSMRELIGCVLVLAAVTTAQLTPSNTAKKE